MASDRIPSTHMSLLAGLADEQSGLKLVALGAFYERYRASLAAVLKGRLRLDPQDTDDILHEFLIKKLIEGSFVDQYLKCVRDSSSNHRPFRHFLSKSVCNFAIDYLRKRKKRDAIDLQDIPAIESELEDALTIEWLQDLLTHSLKRTRQHYVSKGLEGHWTVFLQRWIDPAIRGAAPPTYEELAKHNHLNSARQAGTVLVNALKTFKRSWHQVLIEDLGTENEECVADALRDLRTSLQAARFVDMRRLLVSTLRDACSVPETALLEPHEVNALFGLVANGISDLMPLEQELLFEAYLQTPLGEFDTRLSENNARRGSTDGVVNVTPAQLLFENAASVEDLRVTSRTMNSTIRLNSGEIPSSMAAAIRFLAIARASTCCGEEITSMPPEQICAGISSLLQDSPWIDGRSKSLLCEYLQTHEGLA